MNRFTFVINFLYPPQKGGSTVVYNTRDLIQSGLYIYIYIEETLIINNQVVNVWKINGSKFVYLVEKSFMFLRKLFSLERRP